jgi:hypothetical protein
MNTAMQLSFAGSVAAGHPMICGVVMRTVSPSCTAPISNAMPTETAPQLGTPKPPPIPRLGGTSATPHTFARIAA